ncbi:putative RNA polymerase II subunit B1 CTD phosphatase RPAP2 [Rhynchophorus ferrugineus]|uniref:putative RNA polymerase II subunit B1 CTD phosphatase RPAP2 n=1 Tax=Rhynchophorus ferrugineus TaxID=354439 RepID=UPI003FCCB881
MQDSLEEYIKVARNAKQDEPIKVSKEMVVTAQLKKECDARAMKIVEFSIEGKLRPEVFTRCLPFINQSHYQDIVEERAITKLCGYSLCGKRIPDMPKKQYFISTKSNKVYDITERKNFCSNFCYKASLHIKKQIDNSPLWLRKLEDIPEYKLLHLSEGGLPGEYIDQGVVKPVQEPVHFTSVSCFTEASLSDLADREIRPDNMKDKTKGFKKSRLKSTMQTIKETELEEETQVATSNITTKQCSKRTLSLKKEIHHKISCVVSLPSIEEQDIEISETLQALRISTNEPQSQITEKTEDSLPDTIKKDDDSVVVEKSTKNKGERNKARKTSKKKTSGSKNKMDIEALLKKLMSDWLSLETCIFIHGEQKVKEILTENKLSDYFEELNIVQLQREQQMKYMEICRRLQLQEMADDKFDKALTGGDRLKPLPDYKKLKDDMKELNLKVNSFYRGNMYEKDDPNFPSKSSDKPPEEGPPVVLPPVDVNPLLLRRKIFLTSLNKAMQQLLQALGVTSITSVLSDIKAMVKTFNLKADNITFKPFMWNYIALTLLYLLALKDQLMRETLQEARSCAYIDTFLDGSMDRELLNDMVKNSSQLETFVEKYITKTTEGTV